VLVVTFHGNILCPSGCRRRTSILSPRGHKLKTALFKKQLYYLTGCDS
jgi:hypothetical protein